MKKAQIETMGLVIIVVLLSIIGIFVLIFASKTSVDETEDLFLGMKAGNLASALTPVNVGRSNFGEKVIDCCQGIDISACSEVEIMADSGLNLLDERASLIIECTDNSVKEFGNCPSGVNSEKITLSTGDIFFVRICRK